MTVPELSIVLPSYAEGEHLAESLRVIRDIVRPLVEQYEIIVIDDGSWDETWPVLTRLRDEIPELRGLSLARNFGKEAAILAGLDVSTGKAVIVMDCDLQHPPSLIPQMVALWRAGFKIVNAVKAGRGRENPLYQLGARLFYRAFERLGALPLSNSSDFKLLDREVVDALRQCSERGRFFRGLVAWVGFRHIDIEFDVPERMAGDSKWSLQSLLRYALQSLMAFTSFPLKIVALVGFVTVLAGAIMAVQTFWMYFSGRAVDGFTTVIVLMVIFSGAILTSLGVIAMYIAMMYEEQKARPPYVVRKTDLKQEINRKIGLDAEANRFRAAHRR